MRNHRPQTNFRESGIADPFEIQFNLSDFFALTFFCNALFPVSLIQIGRVRSKSQRRGRFLFVVDHRRTVACNDFQFMTARRHNTNVTCFRANYNYQYFHGAARKNVLETRPQRSLLRTFVFKSHGRTMLNSDNNIHKKKMILLKDLKF